MRPARGMGAIAPSKQPRTIVKKDGAEPVSLFKEGGTAKGGNWIKKAVGKPGALHRQLGVPQGQKIPESRLQAVAGKGGTLGRRARLAETLKGFKK